MHSTEILAHESELKYSNCSLVKIYKQPKHFDFEVSGWIGYGISIVWQMLLKIKMRKVDFWEDILLDEVGG